MENLKLKIIWEVVGAKNLKYANNLKWHCIFLQLSRFSTHNLLNFLIILLNSRNHEKFWIKVPNLYKMVTFTFRLGDHIFFICSLKNHMTWFSDFWSKIIRNILKIFLISCSKIFKLIFLESLAENIGNGYFHYI